MPPSVRLHESIGSRVGIIGHRHLDDVHPQAGHMLATRMRQCFRQPYDQTLAQFAHALIHSRTGKG